jgi:hypothetical protein
MTDDTEEEWAWLIKDVWAGRESALELRKSLQEPAHDTGFQARMKHYESRFRGGQKYALFAALTACIMWCRPLPSWASRELWEAYRRFCEGKLESWNEVFGKPFPGKRRTGKSTQQKGLRVWARVRQLHESEGRHLDESLFEDVGKEFAVSASTASKLYYAVKGLGGPTTITKRHASKRRRRRAAASS